MLRNLKKMGAFAAALMAVTAPARADWSLVNMPRGVTTLSGEIYSLHMLIFWWCVAIGIFVFGWMILSLVKFRKSQGAVPDTNMIHSTKVEIIWTVIPVIILVLMAVPAARTLIKLEDASGTDITIKVTAYQWKWRYEYLNENVDFFSSLDRMSDETRQRDSALKPRDVPNYLLEVDKPMVVPVGAKVRLLLTSMDVIHAWWVPQLAVKKDAIPGVINEIWFEITPDKAGIYRGQCTELCGRDHAFMPIVVEAKSPEDYATWIAEQRAASAPAVAAPAAAAAAAPAAG
jgi:cytochrome c oxidase subunit II